MAASSSETLRRYPGIEPGSRALQYGNFIGKVPGQMPDSEALGGSRGADGARTDSDAPTCVAAADLRGHTTTRLVDLTYRHRLRSVVDVAARGDWAAQR